MEDIAEAAGIAVGTVYNYFADRRELVTALLESMRDELADRIDEAIEGTSNSSFEKRLEALLRVLLRHFEAHRSLFTLALEDELHAMRCGPRRSWAQKLVARLGGLVEEGVESGVLRSGDARHLPGMILGLVRGSVMQGVSRRESLEDLVDPIVRVLMRGAGRR